MTRTTGRRAVRSVALLTEGVDRNVDVMAYAMAHSKSPSSRRAWIEISTPREKRPGWSVALLAEGVDRNTTSLVPSPFSVVALLTEGVDRNSPFAALRGYDEQSPSSRRVWIEIGVG